MRQVMRSRQCRRWRQRNELASFLAGEEKQSLELWLDLDFRLHNGRHAINNATLVANFFSWGHRHHRICCHVVIRPGTSYRAKSEACKGRTSVPNSLSTVGRLAVGIEHG